MPVYIYSSVATEYKFSHDLLLAKIAGLVSLWPAAHWLTVRADKWNGMLLAMQLVHHACWASCIHVCLTLLDHTTAIFPSIYLTYTCRELTYNWRCANLNGEFRKICCCIQKDNFFRKNKRRRNVTTFLIYILVYILHSERWKYKRIEKLKQ